MRYDIKLKSFQVLINKLFYFKQVLILYSIILTKVTISNFGAPKGK